MKRPADIQHNAASCPRRFQFFLCRRHLLCFSGNHDLSRTVIVGDGHIFHLIQNLFDHLFIQRQHRAHGAFSGRHCILHQDPALSDKPHRLHPGHPACGRDRRVFSQRKSGGQIRRNTSVFQFSRDGKTGCDKRRLGILRQIQPVVFFKTEFSHIKPQRLGSFVKHFPCQSAVLIKIFPHSGSLYALPGIQKRQFSRALCLTAALFLFTSARQITA